MIDRAEASELVGTALLLFVIVGSGVAVQQMEGEPASSLFYHAVTVGLGLAVLIALFARTSGAHFNPAVTLALWRGRSIGGQTALPYVAAQVVGAVLGLTVALVSFGDQPALSTTQGLAWGSVLAEYVGTTVLALLIVGAIDQGRLSWVPAIVGGWVTVMVFSSSSTGLLNPAVTIARVFTDTYTGIPAATAPVFISAQLLGALTAVYISTRLLIRPNGKEHDADHAYDR
jgi:glycerol uptake facilitator-like aquaporin